MTTKAPIPFAGLLNRRLLGELAATFEETLAALKSYVQSSIEINASLREEHKRETEKKRVRHREGEGYLLYICHSFQSLLCWENYKEKYLYSRMPFSSTKLIASITSMLSIHYFSVYRGGRGRGQIVEQTLSVYDDKWHCHYIWYSYLL